MRSDALSNRLRILEAAAEVLAGPGDTSLKSIARRAGVGQGTLYRHFPSRECLVLQVYGEEVEELVTAVPGLLTTLSPQHGLCAWLRRLLYVGRCAPEFAEAMRGAGGVLTEPCREAYRPLLDALSALVDANAAAGTIAAGTTAEDVLTLLGPLWRISADGGDQDRDRETRLFEVLMRGLCPGAGPADQ
ncbi:TetR/AcrR family transcriptional regulator [Streptomyces sp. Act143]|uniref:TetR/AcrR family transcriptional regulator n=1 Tax=Streptomyces sp. Act143 TaxID=2200760 RepID=UPI000D683985|nr:TetR/AcrR family transcriptional regulator [Streptomyces sp. Act143]PWI20478.1 TetR/AcrR family transcriptional regulator [Streptomyces sp. Act143]